MIKIIHQIWTDEKPIPDLYLIWREEWQKLHPDWEFKLWTEKNIPLLKNRDLYDRLENYAEISDLMRYDLLSLYPGIYMDLDVKCVAGLGGFPRDVEDFVTTQTSYWWNQTGLLGHIDIYSCEQAILGSSGNGKFWGWVSEEVRKNVLSKRWESIESPFYRTLHKTGPSFITECVDFFVEEIKNPQNQYETVNGLTLFNNKVFIHMPREIYPSVHLPQDTMAAHLFSANWSKPLDKLSSD